MARLPDRSRAREDVLVVPQASAAGLEAIKNEAALVEELEHFLWRRNLERPTSDPVDQIVAKIHASRSSS